MFDFSDMLAEYETDVTIASNPSGAWGDAGKFVSGIPATMIVRGAVLPLSDDELQQGPGGSFTVNDRKLYIHQQLIQGQEVETGGHRYIVRAEKDYSAHASGLRIYILVREGEAGA